jgi:hypothetical protein
MMYHLHGRLQRFDHLHPKLAHCHHQYVLRLVPRDACAEGLDSLTEYQPAAGMSLQLENRHLGHTFLYLAFLERDVVLKTGI